MINRTQRDSIPQFRNPNNNTDNFSGGGADLNIKSLLRGVWTRSLIGLILIAILSTTTFFIISSLLKLNEKSGTIVNISGRQRMLSQRGAFFALQVSTNTNKEEREIAITKLAAVADLMEKSHLGLTTGSDELGLPNTMSDSIKAIYYNEPHELNSQVQEYVTAIRTLLSNVDASNANSESESLNYIMDVAPNRLLTTLNLAVQQYEDEANTELHNALKYERIVYIVTLLTLLMEALFIYRPLVNRVKNTTRAFLRQLQFSDSVVDTSQALIIGLNKSGQVKLFNKHSENLTGWQSSQIINENFMAAFIPSSEREQLTTVYNGIFSGETATKLETTLTTKTGQDLVIEWSNTLLVDPETKEPSLLLATGLDVTQRKIHNEALQQALTESAQLGSRLQEEVAHAAILQKALLPEPDFKLPGIEGLAKLTTSTEVGGDYYDYYQVDGCHSVFLVGDVSGHGVASGTLVSAAKMAVHQLENLKEVDPSRMLEHINESLLTASHESMFMTMVCFSLDSRNGQIKMANAGHVFPYIWIADESEWCMIEAEGVPLGKVQTPDYQAIEFDLELGDKLFVYTDGIIEEESPEGQQFGFERLENLLYSINDLTVAEANKVMFKQLESHCHKQIFSDDVTIMMVEHTERIANVAAPVSLVAEQNDEAKVILLSGSELISGNVFIDDYLSRQHTIITCEETQLNSLIPSICQQGVRRVLLEDQAFLRDLGWKNLLNQLDIAEEDDIDQWVKDPSMAEQWEFGHSDDKQKYLGDLAKLLAKNSNSLPEGFADVVLMMADELIENSLYGAPRDRSANALFSKGDERIIASYEGVRLTIKQNDAVFGMSVTDNWGTLTPSTFLNRILLNTSDEGGMKAGVGGTGMYLMWRFSDYLQIRVLPNQKTQVTLLWSLKQKPKYDSSSSFQFLYHSEVNEAISDTSAQSVEVAA
jgi:PAS domain S-box-containing protein